MTDLLIDMRNISKSYANDAVETNAVSKIDLAIEHGSFVSLVGPSGCGKSTLLSLMGLLDHYTTGHYRLNGLDTAVLNRKAQARIRNLHIGFIFQSFNLISDLTAAENIALPLSWRGDLTRAEIDERVQHTLEKVGLQHRRDFYPSQLSGGQQQRVAVARAVAGNPYLILADEPTGNLDSHNAEKVMSLLEGLHGEGAAVCMVTHDLGLAARAERKIELFDGRIVADQRG